MTESSLSELDPNHKALDNWDPMREAFASGKKYEQGPGADMSFVTDSKKFRNQNDSSTRISIANLPKGITIEGIRNLCLSAGNPKSIYLTQSGKHAFASFDTRREAELAIRDLNFAAPYYLRVTFAKPFDHDSVLGNKAEESENDLEKWTSFECVRSSLSEKLKKAKNTGKLIGNVPGYFPYCCEYDDPSLFIRQKKLDFKTDKECISLGRGYLNFSGSSGNNENLKSGKCLFSVKSDDWNECSDIQNCSACGLITYGKTYYENYCSSKCESKCSSQKNKCVMNVFEVFAPDATGFIEIFKENQDAQIPCRIVLDTDLHDYESLINLSRNTNKIIRAVKNEEVMIIDKKFGFLRGTVLKSNQNFYTVSLTDFGDVVSVKDVYEMSDELKKIKSFGGRATFLSDDNSKGNEIRFRVKKEEHFKSWLCDVENEECELILEEWSPPEELKFVPVESGSSVVISTYINMQTMFVRRIDKPWNEKFIELNNEIAGYALKARKFDKLPNYGLMCGARFYNDNCYYRGIVRTVRKESVNVAFVDFGNEQETKLEDVCYLPSSVREIDCHAVRVKLKGVGEMSSPEAVNYLNRLTAYETELLLTYDAENLEVILTEKTTGVIVNEEINHLVDPIWTKDSSVFTKTSEAYDYKSIGELEFNPGEIEDLFILNVDSDEFKEKGKFWSMPHRSEYLGHLNGELKQRITEYCSYLEDDPYLSRTGEICLVSHEGDWYRAVSLDDRSTKCKVFLIDFGISASVETKNMRKSLKEFLEIPALAIECIVDEFEKLNCSQRERLLSYLESMNKKCVKNVKIMKKLECGYSLSLPFVRSLL